MSIFGSDPNLHPAGSLPPSAPFKPGFVRNLPIFGPYGQAGFLNWTQAADDATTEYLVKLLSDLGATAVQAPWSAAGIGSQLYTEPIVWWLTFPNGFSCLAGPLAVYFLSYPSMAEHMIRADLAWNLPKPSAADDGGNPPHGQ